MITILFYLILLFLLIWWVESPFALFTNSLNSHPAEVLEERLKEFQLGMKGEAGVLPSYKFYTEVTELLLSLARKMGGSYKESLLFLREGLRADRQSEKKLKELTLGTWIQMGFMIVLTWGFILLALNLVAIKVSWLNLAFIGLWQGIGLALLPFLLGVLREKYFGDIGRLWKMLYVLKSLGRVPLSRTEIFERAGLLELKNIRQKSVLPLVEKMHLTFERCLKQGGSYEEDVKGFMEELRFQEKWHFELFEKRLTVIKLSLISLFFLPSYLAFIFFLLNDLMTLM